MSPYPEEIVEFAEADDTRHKALHDAISQAVRDVMEYLGIERSADPETLTYKVNAADPAHTHATLYEPLGAVEDHSTSVLNHDDVTVVDESGAKILYINVGGTLYGVEVSQA